MHKEEDDTSDEADYSSTTSLVVSTQSDEEDDDLVDCRTANRNAIQSQLKDNYIPECNYDGTYKQVQCYKVMIKTFCFTNILKSHL